MNSRKLFLSIAAAALLSGAGAAVAYADPPGGPDHKDGPGASDQQKPGAHQSSPKAHDQKGPDAKQGPQGAGHAGPGGHDRYWKQGFGDRLPPDKIFGELRHHHYDRFDGAPYFFHDHYVVKAFRGGHAVFVEVNPYTGAFIGEIRF
jgi:hypothetical protein